MLAWIPTGRPSDLIALVEMPEPRPRPDEAVVAVQAYSVNRGETFLLNAPRPGWRPGKDIAGTVLMAAADGTGPAAGQRVVAHPEQAGWAEQVAVPVSRIAALPDAVNFGVAAALPLAGLTALRLTRTIGSLAGKRVLLTGASGGVGHYFVELAAAQGAVITAVVGSEARGQRLLELGAAELVTDVDKADGPYDVVMESVGGQVFPAAFSRLTDRGLFVWFGQASQTPPILDFLDWRGGASATVRKFSYADSDISDGDDLATLVRLVVGGYLHPEIDRTTDWHDTPAILQALLARQIRGNAVLTVPR